MEVEKIRNLNPQELTEQQREATEQLFRLKFQMKMGQTGGLKKMRELRKDLARIKTVARERELGLVQSVPGATATEPAPAVKTAKSASAASSTSKKKTARKKTATEKK